MNDKLLEELREIKVDVNTAVERCLGNKALYVKCMRSFIKDNKVKKLDELISAEDYETALSVAHNLKGVTGNLGIDFLYKRYVRIVDDIRHQSYSDLEKINKSAENYYDKLYAVIMMNE